MKRIRFFVQVGSWLLVAILCWQPAVGWAKSGIVGTKHDLSVTGLGDIRALEETRICVFCHTPHNAAPQTPLWNKDIDSQSYDLYQSSTLSSNPSQPSGPTRLCLSCHDGIIALGALKSEAQPVATTMELGNRPSSLGTDISNDHPVSFAYADALPNVELNPIVPNDLMVYQSGNVHCTTCHDAHDNSNSMFLVVDNTNAALCVKCHVNKQGWSSSIHRLSNATWNGAGVNPWPLNDRLDPAHKRQTVAENGCENCHVAHNAEGPKRLLKAEAEEQVCYPCHNGNVATYDIEAKFQEAYVHPVSATTIGLTSDYHDPTESPLAAADHVECMDCHNPHAVIQGQLGSAPDVSGRQQLVSGITENGLPEDVASYEYQICLKCHEVPNDTSHTNFSFNFIERYLNEGTTTRQDQFDTMNPSFHPVFGARNLFLPSMAGSYEPTMDGTTIIYCSDCHSDAVAIADINARRGPHGSAYWPILRQRYEISVGTPNNFASYAICYRCHAFDSIQANDSFKQRNVGGIDKGGHSGHLDQGIPCSVCHDPHGVVDEGSTGSKTNLINFDRTYVGPLVGSVPVFNDTGSYSGNCVLVCHNPVWTHTAADSAYAP